jgi:hypothetical protein
LYDLPPSPLSPSVSSTGDTQETEKEGQFDDTKGGKKGFGGGAKSYDRKKAWSSINHSIFSAPAVSTPFFNGRAKNRLIMHISGFSLDRFFVKFFFLGWSYIHDGMITYFGRMPAILVDHVSYITVLHFIRMIFPYFEKQYEHIEAISYIETFIQWITYETLNWHLIVFKLWISLEAITSCWCARETIR